MKYNVPEFSCDYFKWLKSSLQNLNEQDDFDSDVEREK